MRPEEPQPPRSSIPNSMSRNPLRTPLKQSHLINSNYNSPEPPDPDDATGHPSKRRRISLATSVTSQSFEVSNRSRAGKEKENDRFIPTPTNSPLPIDITPRTKRFAKQIGASKGCFLKFQEKPKSIAPSATLTSPTKKKALSIMRHCTLSMDKNNPSAPSASARYNLRARADIVLDAPQLFDDFYSRPVDWSKDDQIAAATDKTLNIRDMTSLEVTVINTRMTTRNFYTGSITAIKYNPQLLKHIAVGFDTGHTQVWDYTRTGPFFAYRGHAYVGGLSWRGPNADLLSVCYEDGMVKHFDPRQNQFPVFLQTAHLARVTGLAWNEDGSLLVTAGAEDGLKCWDVRMRKEINLADDRSFKRPIVEEQWFVKNQTATMKALAWCPWQPHLIATGGGSQDGVIRIYSTRTASQVSSIETHSQISSLHWSHHTTELLTTHGYAWSPISRYRAPRTASILVHGMDTTTYQLTQVAKAFDPGHGRISDSVMSPDFTRLMTAGADQTVKIWKVFGEPKNRRRKESALRRQLNLR